MVKAPYSLKYTNAVKGIGKPFLGSIFYKINLSQINYSLYNLDCIFYKISREMSVLCEFLLCAKLLMKAI